MTTSLAIVALFLSLVSIGIAIWAATSTARNACVNEDQWERDKQLTLDQAEAAKVAKPQGRLRFSSDHPDGRGLYFEVRNAGDHKAIDVEARCRACVTPDGAEEAPSVDIFPVHEAICPMRTDQ